MEKYSLATLEITITTSQQFTVTSVHGVYYLDTSRIIVHWYTLKNIINFASCEFWIVFTANFKIQKGIWMLNDKSTKTSFDLKT